MKLALRQLDDLIGKYSVKVIDFKQRRITNAAQSQNPDDYVTQQELIDGLEIVTQLINGLIKKLATVFYIKNANTIFNKGNVLVGPKGDIQVTDGEVIVGWSTGSGSPEGVLARPVGSLYTDNAGGAGTVLYVKETGTDTDTGWVAK